MGQNRIRVRAHRSSDCAREPSILLEEHKGRAAFLVEADIIYSLNGLRRRARRMHVHHVAANTGRWVCWAGGHAWPVELSES